MDDTDLVGYLTSKGLSLKTASGGEVITNCIFCGENKRVGKLWLNVETWLWQCWVCGEHGGRGLLLRHFGDEDTLAYVPGTDPAIRRRILTEAAELAHQMLLGNDEKLSYLLGRGLEPDTIMAAKLGYVPQNIGLSRMLPCTEEVSRKDLIHSGLVTMHGGEFFNDSIVIPYFSHGQVVQLRENKAGGKYRTAAGDSVRLYNADALRAATDVIVTEGEFDCLILAQHLAASPDRRLQATAVVGLAGTNAWPDNLGGYFTGSRRVFTGLDPDTAGVQAAAKLKAEIGATARIIELPTRLPKCDWTEYLRPKTATHPHGGHGWADVADLLLVADLAGKTMFSVAEAGAKWGRVRVESPGITLGWMPLDAVLRPGLKPGQLMIPLANTGAGKSVFLSNIAHHTAKRRVLYVSMELTAVEVYEHLRRIHFFWHPSAAVHQLDDTYARLRIVDANRLAKGGMAKLIDTYIEDIGEAPDLILIDYLQYFARGFAGNSRYEKVSDAVMELKGLAKDAGAAMICPSQVNRTAKEGTPLDVDSSRDSGVIEETADFVLSLFRPDTAIDVQSADSMPVVTGGYNAQLLKSRHGGKGRLFNFRFSNLSLVIADTLDRLACARIEQENTAYRRGVNYEDWHAERSAPVQLTTAGVA